MQGSTGRTVMVRWLLVLLLACTAQAVRADDLADRLRSAWEVLWDERGTPQRAFRWRDVLLRYHVRGPHEAWQRELIDRAMSLAARHTGLRVLASDLRPNPAESPLLEFEFVGDGQLDAQVACATTVLRANQWTYEHVRIQLRARHAWTCTHHEVLHAMGLRGHPSGSTILNYLHGRRDTFTDLDAALLAAWYSPRLKPGATLLEAWSAMSDWMVEHERDLPRAKAQAVAAEVAQEIVSAFAALARGEGEVPAIVKRAGRASGQHMGEAVSEAAYVMGMASQRGTLMPRDEAQAVQWWRRAAAQNHAAAQVMLARALRDGRGAPPDKVSAYQWYLRAVRVGSEVARKEIEALEPTLSAGERAAARSRAGV